MIYGDKTVLNANTGVADTYLCKADDMNAIKTFAATGWYPITTEATLTYSSYNSTTKTGVVTTSATLAGLISVGMKMKFTQSSTVKYAIVTAITSTTITLFFGQNGGAVENAAITAVYFSTEKAPYGFPTFSAVYDQLLAARIPFGSTGTGTYYSGSFSFPSGFSISDYEFLIASIGNDSRVFGKKSECQSFIIVPTLITEGIWNVYIIDNFKAGGHWTINDTAISADCSTCS